MSTQPQITEVPQDSPVTALALSKRVLDLEAKIKLFAVIATTDQYISVANIGLAAAKVEKEGTSFYEEEVSRLHRLWKDKCDERSSIIGPAKTIKDLAGRLTGEWDHEQERLRVAEERRQQEIEREKADTETLEIAASLEKEGRSEEAMALIENPLEAAPVSVGSAVPRITGKSKPRDNWKAEVTSLMLLVKAVAEGKVPLQMIQANESALNRMASTLKSELRYPGVKVTNNPKSAFRS